MTYNEFLAKVKEHTELEVREELSDVCIIANMKQEQKYKVTKDTIKESDWDNLYSVLCGREPMVIDGITRIVGYFSKISNWNKSKIGELHDRRKGNYAVR